MTPAVHTEAAFEAAVEVDLLASGYARLGGAGYDRRRALFPAEALAFIRASQPAAWARLEAILGERIEAQVLADLASWLGRHGALATLRHGFKCYGRTLQLAALPAAHGLNDAHDARVAANRLGVTRQLHYSDREPARSLDLVLSLNGLPLVTLELKNPLTGQTTEDAVRQYRRDRDPTDPLFAFTKRALVHFALDPDTVSMTTRLRGEATDFLPFNRGHGQGAGNPPTADGYRTAYLWRDVLAPESLFELVARFVHVETVTRNTPGGRRATRQTMIFPRYHQREAVRTLVAAARADGPGHAYLVEHSAGSGKSNTIAWLAHRLASLHDAADRRVFHSVVVVTDRRVLDQQLQDTIYQFEHRRGVVQRIDEDSAQLTDALEAGVPIVITTLQKFPFVARHLDERARELGDGSGALAAHPYAVIIDEAHSSQGGDAARALRHVLGGTALRDEAQAAADDEGTSEMARLFETMASRGQQANLSLFAFTATPKHSTLKWFGRDGAPVHRYAMRQAIDEGFILDVLHNYVTYATYYRLLKAGADDPHVERKSAAKALARFMRLHPYNVAQKTEVMVEHFQAVTRHRIGEQAKAMVVTASRLAAVRYKQAFDAYIQVRGYDLKTLVAFSGEVADDAVPDVRYTEVGMNGGLRERELPEAFAGSDFRLLLVAEKYQTGFDQPLLHTMYVDRRLDGIQAVQTLSRLNRPHPLKEDTFVLDFVNDRETIRAAFADFYEGATLGDEADPAQLYALQAEIDGPGLIAPDDVAAFCAAFFRPVRHQSPADHRRLQEALAGALGRFADLLAADEPAAELWRGKTGAFTRLYAFLSQVLPYQDSDLEKLYTYLRHLRAVLPRRPASPDYRFDETVRLQYYRLQKITEGAIPLGSGRPLDGPTEVGTGMVKEDALALSTLIDLMNERFGTDFTQGDQLFFDQVLDAALRDADVVAAAQANAEDKFRLVLGDVLETLFVERIDQNEEIFARYTSDSAFRQAVDAWMAAQVQRRAESIGTSRA